MDRKEAADLLDNLIGMVEDSHGADYDTALRMGAEALTANGDIIYRQVALDAIRTKYCSSDFMDDGVIDAFAEIIQDLPSAQPDRGYIEQVKWKRDTAIAQLKELGYGMGEKIRTDTDTISRQAVIDAVVAWTVEDRPNIEMPTDLVGRINALSSAQPEIVRCKDCADYDTSWIPHSVSDRYYCLAMDSFMPEDGFCSFAERRTDG